MSVAQQWKVIGSELPDDVGARLAAARVARSRRPPIRPLQRWRRPARTASRRRSCSSRSPATAALSDPKASRDCSRASPPARCRSRIRRPRPRRSSARSPRSSTAGTRRSPDLPSDWSDLYAEIEFTSSDYIEPAAVLCIQMNPRRDGTRAAFNFRAARLAGYGVAPGHGAPLLRALRRAGDPRLDQRAPRAQRHAPRRHAGPGVALRRQDALS